jgi:hypothetical protein
VLDDNDESLQNRALPGEEAHLDDVVDVGEVARELAAVPPLEDAHGAAVGDGVRKLERSHVGPAPWAVDRKEAARRARSSSAVRQLAAAGILSGCAVRMSTARCAHRQRVRPGRQCDAQSPALRGLRCVQRQRRRRGAGHTCGGGGGGAARHLQTRSSARTFARIAGAHRRPVTLMSKMPW